MESLSTSSNTYELCSQSLDPNLSTDERQDHLIRCLANSLDATNNGINTFYLIYAASLVFYMQAGFAMLCAGSVRIKNLQNTMLKNLLDACGSSLGFYTVGYAFAWGGSSSDNEGTTFIGTENFFLMDVEQKAFWLFQFAFAATSATIVAGTLVERCQMLAYLLYSAALTAFVYPVVVHSIWNKAGFLSSYSANPLLGVGVVDFAGSLVVHTTGGLTALIAAFVLGPRAGRFYFDDDGRRCAKDFPGHSVALKVLGVLILWFGWYGFNTGSVYSITGKNQSQLAQNAAVNTTLAAAGGTISALLAKAWLTERSTGEAIFSLTDALMGCLGGLVSIAGGCAYVESWAAITIGIIAGLLYLIGSRLLIRIGVDDAVDAIPVHMFCGVWGCISVGFFATPKYLEMAPKNAASAGLFYSNGNLLACQLIGVLFVVGWVSVLMIPFFSTLHYMGWLRADSLEEIVGLDISYHGGTNQSRSTESGNQDNERLYYERREQQRQNNKQRTRLRRRLLMMDLSISGRHAMNNSRNSTGDGPSGNITTRPREDAENPGDGPIGSTGNHRAVDAEDCSIRPSQSAGGQESGERNSCHITVVGRDNCIGSTR